MLPLNEIAAAQPGLVAKLRKISFASAAQLAAGLSLSPELHANAIRIEALQHVIAGFAAGNKRIERNDLADWITKYYGDSPLAQNEDPVEDVFIGVVNSRFGSFEVPLGIYADADFWVERLLLFLTEKEDFPPFGAALKSVVALLRLSSALVRRTNLNRFTVGAGERAGRIVVPRWRDMEPRVRATAFTNAALAEAGIAAAELAPFVMREEDRTALRSQNIWSSSLERRPFIPFPDGLILAAPSSICRAAVRLMADAIQFLGGWADIFFGQECASMFVNEIARQLGIEPITFDRPEIPEDLPALFPFFGAFDDGKPVIMLTHCPTLMMQSDNHYSGFDELAEKEQNALNGFVRACAAKLEGSAFSGGMVLVAVAAPLRANAFQLHAWSERWRIHICTLPDWLTLVKTGDCTAMRLWKLGDHEELLRRNGTHIANPAGLINLFAAWQGNGFRLLPKDQSVKGLTLLTLQPTFAAALRDKARKREHARAFLNHTRTEHIRVIRHNASALFREDEQFRLYVAPDYVARKTLLGFVDEQNFGWWIMLEVDEANPTQRSLAFQLWECVFHWTARASKTLLEWWPVLRSKQSIEIRIHLPELGKWKDDKATVNEELETFGDAVAKRVSIRIPEGFIQQFHTAKNTAERKIVAALVRNILTVALQSVDESEVDRLTQEIVRNDDARYFHVVRARRFEQLFGGENKPAPLFVTDEDFAFSELGLAFLLPDVVGGTALRGVNECRDFLKNVVEKLWERIEAKLAYFDHHSVLDRCLGQLDENARDEERWDMTARAQFALRDDSENVHEVLHERRSDRDRATLCNRLMIETSQYSCKTGLRPLSKADHLSLLADMAVLVMLAHHRDAIAFGFLAPEIAIHENGEIAVDESFYSAGFGRYITSRSEKRSQDAVASYEDFFSAENKAKDHENQEPFISEAYEAAFLAEYGFTVSELLKVLDAFRELALKSKVSRAVLTDQHMHMALSNAGLSPSQAATFLERFTLPFRPAWDAERPGTAKQQDVFPWRFRRQLSLLTRPIPQIFGAARTWFVSVPVLQRGLSYFLGNLEQGAFPREFFRSKEMIHFIGDTVNRRGHNFARQVFEVMKELGLEVDFEVEMTKLGAEKNAGLGDVDVLAWLPAPGFVFAIECKNLLPAVTVREVIQRLEDFQGNRAEKDALARHLRRIDWLQGNRESLARFTGISAVNMKIVPLLVTSEIVPMQFFSGLELKRESVVPIASLKHHLVANWLTVG